MPRTFAWLRPVSCTDPSLHDHSSANCRVRARLASWKTRNEESQTEHRVATGAEKARTRQR
eukprot:3554063-Rhodomonas_salina.5